MLDRSAWLAEDSSTQPWVTLPSTRRVDEAGSSRFDWTFFDPMPRWTVWRALPRTWRRPTDVFICLSDLTLDTFFDAGVMSSLAPTASLRRVIQEAYPLSAPGIRLDVNVVAAMPALPRKASVAFADLNETQLAALDLHFTRVRPLSGERLAQRRAQLERANRFFRTE